ncbi:MAG TPA: DUF6069 family protein [Acidimicrobiales bacterium]|jgi:hypothetical protein
MLKQVTSVAKFDPAPPHRAPSLPRVAVAMAVAIVCSVAADGLLVAVGEWIFPRTAGYAHFQFADFSKLTVIGVVIASIGWPVVARFTHDPRWVFLRLAIVVTIVLWLPDVYIWHVGQPANAVTVLMVMHVAIAVVTYYALMRLAPVRPQRSLSQG